MQLYLYSDTDLSKISNDIKINSQCKSSNNVIIISPSPHTAVIIPT